MNQFADVTALFGQTGKALQDSAKQLADLNSETLKTFMADYTAGIQAASSVKTPEEFFKLQASALQAAPEKLAAYFSQVKEILTAATADQRVATEAQIADVQGKFLEAINGALKNVPGSENTVQLVKSAIAAANNAYEGANKVSKQVTDAVDANVTKFTETAVKASTKSGAKAKA